MSYLYISFSKGVVTYSRPGPDMLKMLFGIINVANCAKGSVLAPLFSLLSGDVGRSENLEGDGG
jgi:hypothetical protein